MYMLARQYIKLYKYINIHINFIVVLVHYCRLYVYTHQTINISPVERMSHPAAERDGALPQLRCRGKGQRQDPHRLTSCLRKHLSFDVWQEGTSPDRSFLEKRTGDIATCHFLKKNGELKIENDVNV